MKTVYVKPVTEIVRLNTGACLMTGSTFTETISSVEEMNEGTFGSRVFTSIWDDDEEVEE